MCPKPLEVTRTSLATYYTGLCNSSSRNPYSLNKGLLVKYWWCLTNIPWTPSTSSPSTSHLHMSNGKLKFNAVSLRLKHNPKILFMYRKIFHTLCPCIHRQCKTISSYIKSYSKKNYFILFPLKKKNLNFVNSAHKQCSWTMSQSVTQNSVQSQNLVEYTVHLTLAQPALTLRAHCAVS